MKPQVILSVEQALTMSYATVRLVQAGHRVIKIEPTPFPGQKSKGDPNRYIGKEIAGKDRHSYFIPTNVGKESIALNLKTEKGKKLLHTLIKTLKADVFCTNTLPARHGQLGFDYHTLQKIKKDLIWCSISAMGLSYPEIPGYDPIIQALCGYMDLTGESKGPPLICGIPIIDLKAGDEAFTQIYIALAERLESGKGSMIDISMGQVAISWLQTFLPLLDMGSEPTELKRSGNEHRQFVPVNTYKCLDGYIYLAIGSDVQWKRLIAAPPFCSLNQECYGTNEERKKYKDIIHKKINTIVSKHSTGEISKILSQIAIPHSPITPIEKVADLPYFAPLLLKTQAPDGRVVRLPPSAFQTKSPNIADGSIPFAPSYGQNTDFILAEADFSDKEITTFREQGIIA